MADASNRQASRRRPNNAADLNTSRFDHLSPANPTVPAASLTQFINSDPDQSVSKRPASVAGSSYRCPAVNPVIEVYDSYDLDCSSNNFFGYADDLGLGSPPDFGGVEFVSDLMQSSVGGESSRKGLQLAGVDSDSDSEEVRSGVSENNASSSSSGNGRFVWPDFRGFEEPRTRIEEFELEEVDERANGGDGRRGLTSVIHRIEDISISAPAPAEQHSRTIERWEVPSVVDHLNRTIEIRNRRRAEGSIAATTATADGGVIPRLNLAAYYDALFRLFVETDDNPTRGSPPAAKSVVENLPSVVEENDSESCAVCTDDPAAGENMTQLPCLHRYHGDCILQWLIIRNSFPVCRREQPADDHEYEHRTT